MGERLVGCAPKGATTSQLCLPFYKHFTATRFFRQTQLKQSVGKIELLRVDSVISVSPC